MSDPERAQAEAEQIHLKAAAEAAEVARARTGTAPPPGPPSPDTVPDALGPPAPAAPPGSPAPPGPPTPADSPVHAAALGAEPSPLRAAASESETSPVRAAAGESEQSPVRAAAFESEESPVRAAAAESERSPVAAAAELSPQVPARPARRGLSDADAAALGACVAAGGVAVFPADTVYGLACDPHNERAIARLYALKGRPPEKPSATMYFDLGSLPPTPPRVRAALERLLPGMVTVVLPGGLGVRVPFLAPVGRPILQTSANFSGEPDARRLEDVPQAIRDAANLVIDGGELPGTPSTVIDLREYESGRWAILRLGAVPRDVVAGNLDGVS